MAEFVFSKAFVFHRYM